MMSMSVFRTMISVDTEIWKEFEHEVIERFGSSGHRREALEEALSDWNKKGGKKKQ